MNNEKILACLKAEVGRTDAHTERECGTLLEQIAWVLLSSADGNTTFVKSEQILSTGRVDVIVLAESLQPGGSFRREAHIWELKAPQLPLFEIKTKSQAQPTAHLYEAETQLMHYCYSVANDLGLLRRWEILSPEHVRLGGVIIGRDGNFVDNKGVDGKTGTQLAREANEVREIFYYRRMNMSLWTWDKVISIAERQQFSHQKFIGDPGTLVDLKGKADLSATITATP
jgi:hypothetical protein